MYLVNTLLQMTQAGQSLKIHLKIIDSFKSFTYSLVQCIFDS